MIVRVAGELLWQGPVRYSPGFFIFRVNYYCHRLYLSSNATRKSNRRLTHGWYNEMAPLNTGWELLSPFLLRTTGFPYQMIEGLRSLGSLTAADAWCHAVDTLQVMRTSFWEHDFPVALDAEGQQICRDQGVFRTLRHIHRTVAKGQAMTAVQEHFWASRQYPQEVLTFPSRWNAAVQRVQATWEQGRQMYEEQLAIVRKSLGQIAANQHFQEAVFLSSPQAFAHLERYLAYWRNGAVPADTYKVRRGEQLCYAYLNRFCAKNDTTSFFGPVNYGQFNAAQSLSVRRRFREQESLGKRRVFVAYWIARTLSQKLSADPQLLPYLAPRLNPLARLLGAGRIYMHGLQREVRLPEPLYRLLSAIDGEKTLRSLAEELQMSEPEAVKLVETLQRTKLVESCLPISPTAIDALEDLRGRVVALPPAVAARQAAIEVLEEAERHRRALEVAPWPKRLQVWEEAETWFAQHVSQTVQRGNGALYADRLALYEDCQGTLEELEIGGPLYRALTGPLVTVLHLYAVAAALRWLDYQVIGHRVYERMRPTNEVVRYIDMIMLLEQEPASMPLSEQLALQLSQILCQRAEAGEERGEITLTQADIKQICEPFQEMAGAVLQRHGLLLPSADVLVAASSMEAIDRGDFRLVLGELHDDCSSLFGGFFAYFHPDPQALYAILEQRLHSHPGWKCMASIVSERRNKYVTPELPGKTILLAATSSKDAAQVIPIHQVEVREHEGALMLWADQTPLLLYPGDLRSVAHGCFSLPRVVPFVWEPTAHCIHRPRVSVDGIIVQREQWCLSANWLRTAAQQGFELFAQMRHLQRRYGWPDQIFVRWSDVEKPVMIDMAIPMAVRWLRKIAQQAQEVCISEMYPAPADLWWQDSLGTHTLELRTAYFYQLASLQKDQE